MKKSVHIFLPLMITLSFVSELQAENLKLHGIVMDKKTHEFLSGATVSAIGEQATHDVVTDSEGKFLLSLQETITRGDIVRVRVSKAGYEGYDLQAPASPDAILTVSLSRAKPAPDGRPRKLHPQNSLIPTPTSPATMHPIEVSLNCYQQILPITVPAGDIGRVVGFNEAYSKVRSQAMLREVVNTAGTGPLVWPDIQRIEEAKRSHGPEETFAWRCEVINHGQDNVVELSIPLHVLYRLNSSYLAVVPLNPLDHGTRVNFYLVNDCPVELQVQIPATGSAKLAGEQSLREFKFDQSQPGSYGFQLGPSYANWLQMTCTEAVAAPPPPRPEQQFQSLPPATTINQTSNAPYSPNIGINTGIVNVGSPQVTYNYDGSLKKTIRGGEFKATLSDPNPLLARIQTELASGAEQEEEKALADAQTLMALEPMWATPHVLAGLAYVNLGNQIGAKEELQKAKALVPSGYEFEQDYAAHLQNLEEVIKRHEPIRPR